MGRRAILAGRESEAAALYLGGKTVCQVAETLGVSFGAAYRALRKSGVALRERGQPAQPRPPRPALPKKPKQPAPAPKRKLDDAEPIKCLLDKQEQISAEEMARALDVSTFTLRARMREFSLSMPPPPRTEAVALSEEPPTTKLNDPEEIRRLYYGRQLSAVATAKALGVSVEMLRRRMQEFGLPVRSQSEAANLSRTQAKRAQLLDEARAVELAPPNIEKDRCEWRLSGVGQGGSLRPPLCGRPTMFAGSLYCREHGSCAAGISRKPLHTKLRLMEIVRCECAFCHRSEEVTADESRDWFARHRAEECPCTGKETATAEVAA